MSEPSHDLGEDPRPPPPPQSQDIEGLQQQFEQQQTLISQLKGAIQSNEQQLATKEKEVEVFAAKLSGIKSRTKASKRSSKSGDAKRTSNEEAKEKRGGEGTSTSVVTEDPVQVESVEREGERKDVKKSGKNSEKSRLLRKKLEENRMKFEQRGKEMSENKKGIEEMVENLRMQLEERNQVIQTLQKGLESNPAVPSVPTPAVRPEILHVSPESNVGEQTDQREMYAQIVYKDNKIVELNNRIMELELNVLDLQENLKEKDAVIDARTKAITLMSEDMSRKSKTTLDTLDDTREQMRLMQNNFITLEARMKDEQEQLKKHLEEKDRKLKYVEESHKKLEILRFDLTTNIAELQEKVVHLQSMNSALQRQSKQRESRGEKQDQVEELLHSLEESNKQMLKIKAQHKNKVKSLTKQIESLKKVSESGDEILLLQQRVAELEEDKGNLQLHLVDFDELKATELNWKQRIQELEEKVKQQDLDLDSHVRALSRLESEKLNLIEGLQSEKSQVSELDRELKALQLRTTEIENLKVTAEMKMVELEELVDILSREKSDLQRENESLTSDRSELKQLLDTLQQEKAELLEEVTTLQTLLKENNPGDTDSNRSEFQMVSSNNSDEEKWKRLPTPEETLTDEKHVKDSSNVELYVKLLESELEDARKVISEEKDTIHNLKLKLEAKEEEIEMHLEVISKLEQLGREVSAQGNVSDVNKVSEILKELNEMAGDLEEWKKRCSEVEDRLKCLEEEKVNLERKLEEVTNENSLLNAQLSLQKQVSEDLVSQVREKIKIISEKDELIKEIENKNVEAVEEQEPLNKRQWPEDSSSSDQAQHEIISLKEQLENLRKVCEDFNNEIAVKDLELLKLREMKEKFDVEQKSASDMTLRVQDELLENQTLIETLKNECQELKFNLEKLHTSFEERSQPMEALQERIQQMELLLNDKDTLLSEKEGELEKLNQKLKTLTDKVKKLAVNLKAKNVVIQNLEEKNQKSTQEIHEKEEIISKLRQDKENICAELESWKFQCEEKESNISTLSDKIESNLQFQDSIIGQLVSQNKDLQCDLNVTVDKFQVEASHADENRVVLINQILQMEKELSSLKIALHNKDEEIVFFKEACTKLPDLEEEKKSLEENKAQIEEKNQELIKEILKKEDELTELSLKLDDLSKSLEIKNEHIEMGSIKFKELEQIIVTKEMQVTALEDRLSNLQNSWSALEAKLQEREAFIESLEQELAKSHAYQQHLEEGLSSIEERRRSIENKFAALGEQLQESDRIKVEAEEHEGELAYRLAALASSEEVLRKRLETLNENCVELSQKISELTLENEELKRNIVNADNNFKLANKEIERLSLCEASYQHTLETIEKLEEDLKKRTIDFERTIREKEQQSSQYAENLELDMRNLNKQIEVLETEKRSVMEHCETLNDMKMNLEDDIETLQEKVDAYQSKILELQGIIQQKESEWNSLMIVKQDEIVALKKTIEKLESELSNTVSIPRDIHSVAVQTHDNSRDNSSSIEDLKSELETVSKQLAQREEELLSYQNRLLQLQFSSGGSRSVESGETERRELESSVMELQEKLSHKDDQVAELRAVLETANAEMSNMQFQLASSCKKIEEMSSEMCNLHEIVKSKDSQLQEQMEQISHITSSNRLSQQLEYINSDYQMQLSTLQQQNSQLHQELVKEKAQNVVSEILSSAQKFVGENRNVQEDKSSSIPIEESKVQFDDNVTCISFQSDSEFITGGEEQMSKQIIPDSHAQNKSDKTKNTTMFSPAVYFPDPEISEVDFPTIQSSDSNNTQELVEKLGDLRAELDVLKNEKARASMKVQELEMEVNRLLDVEKQLRETQGKLEMLIASQSNREMGNEQCSKESSVESECLSEKKECAIEMSQKEDVKFSFVDIPHENVQQAPTSQQFDLNEPAWVSEVLDEEGWGWGAEEARLEEEHMERQKAALSCSSAPNELQQQVTELENKIDLLEKEKSKISEELKASQIRSGKMLKKLKDLKLKNENLMRENQEFALKKSEFGGLDLAIEEELKIRIDSLEKELKECKGERDAVNIDKEGLQRRIEALTATNERLAEREQQGLDIEFWQNKNKELVNQVESLQWRIEELQEEKDNEDRANKGVNLQELQEQIAALATDNEQLQSMLEEQRNLRVGAEAALKDLQQFTSSKEANLIQEADIKENYLVLRENYDMLCKEVEALRTHTGNDSLIAENAVLRENYEVLRRELEQLRSSSNSDIIAAEYSSMRNNYEAMYNELEDLRSRVDMNNTLQANYESLQMAHEKLINEMNHMQREYYSITEKYETILKEKTQVEGELSEKSKTMQANYEMMLNQLGKEKTELLKNYETISLEFSSVSGKLQQMKDEIGKYKDIVANMTHEEERLNAMNSALNEEILHLKDEIEKYRNIVSTMTQEHDRLKEDNRSLNEKHETLVTSSSVPAIKPTEESKVSVLFSEETFAPIQLFSKIDKETVTDVVEKSCVEIQAHDPRMENDLEKEIIEYKSQILKLEEMKKQKIEELDVLRTMFSNEQEEWANIEQNLTQKIEALEAELGVMKEAVKRESEVRENLMLKEHELSNIKSQLSYMEEELTKSQEKVEDLEAQLLQKEEEFQSVNRNSENQENMIQQIIYSKEQELNKLHESLILKQQEQEELLISKEKDIENLKLQIADRESEIRNVITMKDDDVENIKRQMFELEEKAQALMRENNSNIQVLQEQLTQNNIEIENLSQALKDKELTVIELQEALEAREDEIREAVIQIRDRNIEIQRLKQSSGIAVDGSSAVQVVKDSQTANDNQLESSQENELDLALYMLHQRDVRCEELTLELMQLLEERDTLQLRLSTALRINEELRHKISKPSNTSSPLRTVPSQTELESLPNTSDIPEASEKTVTPIDNDLITSEAEGPREDLKVLADKLSQLHSVDYRKDVTLQDEREQRHSEQLMLLQPRGPGVLVESNYTLSRDVQSPSTVLLNWIWGRSTPKVMHI
ncbi:Protein lava lamp [Gryllus bimaculatus]|nr:Protein lava lamp [Gryllus bimaculatus]